MICLPARLVPLAGSALLALTLFVLLPTLAPSHASPPPPFVTTSPGITVTVISTPTLPARLTLVAPAFVLTGDRVSPTLSVHYDRFADVQAPLLAYRAVPAGPWRRVTTWVDERMQQLIVNDAPPGEYALVKLDAAADSLPANAVVIDDLAPGFTRSGPSANWHEATTPPSAYYLDHAYWTYSISSTVGQNDGVWMPSGLNGAYEVLVFVPANYATTQYAYYHVYHDGQLEGQPIDQSIYWAEWVSLGTFDFVSGTGDYVALSNITYEDERKWVAFDAVAFVSRQVYLPVVIRNFPLPPLSPKLHTGIHLGNRTTDWTADMLRPIDGDQGGGSWPTAVVVLGDQVWQVERSATSPCGIVDVYPRADRPIVYDYLKRAAQNGVQVIVRIYPSPGNFIDWDDPGRQNHHLRPDNVPAGGQYCYDPIPDDGKWSAPEYYRAIDDIADEMGHIHLSNVADGWSEAGFGPANEPNIEWYSRHTTPTISSPAAWDEMDAYFSALYQDAHVDYPDVNVFTPPMAQGAYAEGIEWSDFCAKRELDDESVGYEYMQDTYGASNDGYLWHNYWNQGRESPVKCEYGGGHVYSAFPDWMQTAIFYSSKPVFIAEADLYSQCQLTGNPLQWKDDSDDLPGSPEETAQSLLDFSSHNAWLTDANVFWLLADDTGFTKTAGECDGLTDPRFLREHDWHEAYDEDDRDPPLGEPLREWFTTWWPQAH